MIPRTALPRGTKMVRGRFVDDMKNTRVKSRSVAAEVARNVRHDVCCNARLEASSAQRSVLRHRGSVRAREHR